MKNLKVIYSLSVAIVVLLSFTKPLAAQKFEVVPFIGYETSAKINSISGGVFRINDGMAYGGSLSYGFGEGYRVELTYTRQGSDLTYTIDDNPDHICDLAVNEISFGAVYEYNPEDKVVPFGRFALGSTIYQPLNSDTESEKIMHFSFAGGAKINLSSHIGFRLQANLYLPLFFEGLYFSEGPGGEEPEVGTQVAGVQGEFTGGIIFRF
jgi:hypothetical protein